MTWTELVIAITLAALAGVGLGHWLYRRAWGHRRC